MSEMRQPNPPGASHVTADQRAGLSARVPIWSAGRFTALSGQEHEFSGADLAASAAAYDPARYRAPWVKGHPKVADPAEGWADRLSVENGLLFAESSQIDPAFAEQVRAGRFARISPTFFPPDHRDNPVPGVWYLKSIGWLGAHPPANKRLPAPAFAEGEGPDLVAPAEGRDTGPVEFAELDPTDIITPEEEPMPPEADPREAAFAEREQALTEREASFAEREAQIAGREQRLAEQAREQHRGDCAAFADGLADQGRLLARDVPFVTELLAAIPADQEVSFAEGDGTVTAPTAERLREFLGRLPKQVDFAERSAHMGNGELAESDAQIGARAQSYRQRQAVSGVRISAAQAVDAVRAGRDKE
jgi:hypothetical protein